MPLKYRYFINFELFKNNPHSCYKKTFTTRNTDCFFKRQMRQQQFYIM